MGSLQNSPKGPQSLSQRHRPTIDIPFEIWSNVASFLPPHNRRSLYPVNHAFFVIAMDERYNTVHLGSDGNHETISRILSCLIYAHRTQRVRALYLYPDGIADYLPQLELPINTMTAMLRNIQQRTRSIVTVPGGWSAKAQMITKIIRNMSNVQALTLCPSSLPPSKPPRLRDLEYVLRIITANGWTTFGSNLRTLTLNLSYEGYFYALAPDLVFPCLEQLVITLSQLNRTNDGPKLLCDLLVPFVNNHHSSLERLQLAFISYAAYNISPCLLGLHRLPHLRQLYFRHDFGDVTQINTLGLRHILETHSDILRDLELHFAFPHTGVPSIEWYTQEFFHVVLPQLESLTLGSGFYLDLGRTAAYLQGLGDSLVTAVLDNNRLSCSKVNTLLNGFVGRDTLRTLYICVTHLSPELLDMLAMKLPNLDFLKVTSSGVCISESEQRDDRHLFCEVMRDRSYPDWKLRYLIACFANTFEKESVLSKWKVAIKIALPRIQTVRVEKCGV